MQRYNKSSKYENLIYFLNFLSEYCPNWYAIKIGINAKPIYFSMNPYSIKPINNIAEIIIKIISKILLFIMLFCFLINANGWQYEKLGILKYPYFNLLYRLFIVNLFIFTTFCPIFYIACCVQYLLFIQFKFFQNVKSKFLAKKSEFIKFLKVEIHFVIFFIFFAFLDFIHLHFCVSSYYIKSF